MKSLSDFKDEQGIKILAQLITPIFGIVSNAKNAEAKDKGLISFAAAMLENSADDVYSIFAILSETERKDYHIDAVDALVNVMKLFEDEKLMELFGLQSETLTSAGSASESLEVTQ